MKKIVIICAGISLFAAGTALAQSEGHNTTRSSSIGEVASGQAKERAPDTNPARKPEGVPPSEASTRSAATPATKNGSADTGQGASEARWFNKKLKKLPMDPAGPLEPMDETDPCPTLPC